MEPAPQTPKMDATEHLPEDITFFEIFSRLPLRPLYIFRCVSNNARSLISNPIFIKAYLTKSPRRSLLSFCDANNQPVFYILNPVDDSMDSTCQARKMNYSDNDEPNDCAYARKSINGLLCLTKEENTVIWNVGMNDQVLLPIVENYLKSDTHFVYFCHDPATDKYTVLRVTSVGFYHTPNLTIRRTTYMILTLGVNVTWRVLPQENLFQMGRSKSVCINGVLYCTNFSRHHGNIKFDGVIVAFHVGSEQFETISYPAGLSKSRYRECCLVEVKERLAVIDMECLSRSGDIFITLWTNCNDQLESVIGFDSWIERRIVFPVQWKTNLRISHNVSFCTNRNGEILMAASGFSISNCWIFRYNLVTGTWKKVEVLGIDKPDIIFGNFLTEDYVENPVKASDICIA